MDKEKIDKPFSTSQEWYQFISKINDRNLSRQSSSGFTSWALLGVMSIIFYKLIDRLILISKMTDNYLPVFIVWVTIISTIILICIFLLIIFSIKVNLYLTPRLTANLSKKTKPLAMMSFFITSFLWLVFSILSLCLNEINITWPFIIISFFFFMFCSGIIFDVFDSIVLRISFGRKHKDVPTLSSVPIFTGKDKYKQLTFILVLVILQIFSFLFMVIGLLENDKYLNLDCIKGAIELNILLILFIILTDKIIVSLKHAVLEDIETQVFIDQLPPEEIKKNFTENILGESTKEWIIKIKAEINKKIDDLMEIYENIENEMKVINQINKDYKHEIQIRKNDLYKKLELNFLDYESYMNCALEYFRRLLKQNAFADIEKEFLNNTFSEFQVKLTEVRKKLKSIKKIDLDEMKSNG